MLCFMKVLDERGIKWHLGHHLVVHNLAREVQDTVWVVFWTQRVAHEAAWAERVYGVAEVRQGSACVGGFKFSQDLIIQ